MKTFAHRALLALIATATLPALADPPSHGGYYGGYYGGSRSEFRGSLHWHSYWGPLYGVPAHYPIPGRVVTVVPQSRVVVWGGVNYYWGSGVWYRPYGPSFIVVAPPLGVVVPTLPPTYTVQPIGGATYYIANDVYYAANPGGSGYVVAAPPPGENAASQGVASNDDRIFVYPRNNQNAERQSRDHFECHEWAMRQSGFDPMLPQLGSTRDIDARRSDYTRALGACMDGRGYTVR